MSALRVHYMYVTTWSTVDYTSVTSHNQL